MQRLRLPQPEPSVTIGAGPDLACDLLRAGAHLRCLADLYQSDTLRDALIELSSQCDATAAIVLRCRGVAATGAQAGPERAMPARTAPAAA